MCHCNLITTPICEHTFDNHFLVATNLGVEMGSKMDFEWYPVAVIQSRLLRKHL